ncbi:MAG: L-aspartate oxidase [Pseudomonadota bacterium]
MQKTHYDCGDVLIVGAGLAGLYTALKLAPLGVSVLAAAPLEQGASSNWAQGGIAAALAPGDTVEDHARDTMQAGCYINDPESVAILTRHAAESIYDLFSYGVPFDRDDNGAFLQGREAAHSANRIVKVGGDGTGRRIMQCLVKAALAAHHIRTYASYAVFDLARSEHGRVSGVYARALGSEEPILFSARHIIFATGGIGHLYRDTTNPYQIRGEGLGIAARHHARLRDTEFVQFHPTALNIGLDPCPLVTEALRGEGAFLINEKGERFMEPIHPDAELAPRDVVARAVAAEYARGGKAFLDTRQMLGSRIKTAFPVVTDHCIKAGIDPEVSAIPIKPAQHYHMGGIRTDSFAQSSIAGLYVVGEAAGTGAHGANRLASNSLLEAVVFSARLAEHIKGQDTQKALSHHSDPIKVDRLYAKEKLPILRMIMTQYAGLLRTQEGLEKALNDIIKLDMKGNYTAPFTNYAFAAMSIVEGALRRKDSIGAHFLC